MKYAKEEILVKAIKILKSLNPDFFKESDIERISFSDKDVEKSISGENIDTWTVIIKESIFDASEFLVISDETGEPLYYQNFNMIISEIEKKNEGDYKIKDLY
ncbi:hypothetical protein [Myroides odoratus]|uniref:Uncharacterized protein n=1 Tax=Myroides odoratus TaxID=256 RepID=A0A9Q6ZB84_MYROD|nr:hypothetical protein [Myroides odoratus]EHQ43029.1 hypothetical protein Myrod_2203 [Myroides odoratus DSM 2801]EKB06786.1 hypothetical protein HMPREF9716_02065 [Myroides odoratus CIP 103059]QQU00375.1 hypothetical protein I6I88_00970 [Myroides odoratus]WQD57392.1 hypothetical protein U0010_18060 [Myroides odoratus]STZ30298.1 Uncharacterised protein [Myroides odoratus]